MSGGGEEVGTRGAGSISSGGASEAVAAERQDHYRFKKQRRGAFNFNFLKLLRRSLGAGGT